MVNRREQECLLTQLSMLEWGIWCSVQCSHQVLHKLLCCTDESPVTHPPAHAQDLPEGPYLASMRSMHLGNNHFQRFPSALLTAKKVRLCCAVLCGWSNPAAVCRLCASACHGMCTQAVLHSLSFSKPPRPPPSPQLEALYLASQSGSSGGGGSGRSSPGSVSSGCSLPRSAAGVTQRLVLYDTGGWLLGLLLCCTCVVCGVLFLHTAGRAGAAHAQQPLSPIPPSSDVEGLLQLPSLRTIVMNTMQPQVRPCSAIMHALASLRRCHGRCAHPACNRCSSEVSLPPHTQVVVGSQRHDFTWLQRVLKQQGMRLTSNELAYDLQTKVGTQSAVLQHTGLRSAVHGGWLVGWLQPCVWWRRFPAAIAVPLELTNPCTLWLLCASPTAGGV